MGGAAPADLVIDVPTVSSKHASLTVSESMPECSPRCRTLCRQNALPPHGVAAASPHAIGMGTTHNVLAPCAGDGKVQVTDLGSMNGTTIG